MGSPVALTQGAAGLDFAVAGQGTCSRARYNAGDTCTSGRDLYAQLAGLRNGGVILEMSTETPSPPATYTASALGRRSSFLPGSQSTLGSRFGFRPVARRWTGAGTSLSPMPQHVR